MNKTTNQITENQMKALRNFDVPEATIQTLGKKEASDLLTDLISKVGGKPRQATGKAEAWYPLEAVRENLDDATSIVMDQFGLQDKSQLTEVHLTLIQEVSRQVYGIRYWVGKPNTGFD